MSETIVPEYSISNKFKRVNAGEMLYPAACFSCGTISDDDGFVDTEVQIEWVGAIYFCASCCVNLGQVIGCASPKVTRELERTVLEQARELEALKERADHLEGALDVLSVDRLKHRTSDSADLSDVSSPETLQHSAGDDQLSDSVSEPEGSDESESLKSVKVERSNDSGDSTAEHELSNLLDL